MLNTFAKQSRLSLSKTSFLICDVQDKFRPLIYRAETLIKKISFLNEALQILEVPCLIAEQYPKALGRTVPDIVQFPTTKLFEKSTFSMLGNEELRTHLLETGRNQVDVVGNFHKKKNNLKLLFRLFCVVSRPTFVCSNLHWTYWKLVTKSILFAMLYPVRGTFSTIVFSQRVSKLLF